MSTSEFVDHNDRKTNRLFTEKSPYLLQHAYNPVDWYTWGEDAFAKATADNKPVFLSIGYSTCHWCHVMERESFEDDEVAEILNRDFVAIKVDREERPDVDHIYMAVCQAMTGRGGWPLTVILTPDRKPFFAGTYFPKRQKNRQRGLMELLTQIAEKWKEDPARIQEISTQVVEDMESRVLSQLEGEINRSTLDVAYDQYAQTFDQAYGGFGTAPKFPTSHNLSLLLRYYDLTGEEEALHMVEHTLDAMYRGGMYDHIGMGFSRYSTDEKWLVPHFEKMLYDNALLTITYTEAYLLTGEEKYEQIAQDILAYVSRDMTDSEGGFYSAEDADSEGVEGKFYVWNPHEVKEVLGDEEGQLFNAFYDITEEGNFEGYSIPNLIQADLCSFVAEKGLTFEELGNRLEASRQKLFEHREKRIHPHKDDKILTAWNGLMIAAYALAGRAFQEPKYTEQARRADQFLWNKLRREDGRLLARYRDGEAAYLAYLDDYAFYTWGLIELYQTTYETDFLRRAIELTDEMLRLFHDDEKGGLFFYGSDAEQLFSRPKEIYDGAIPSGNSAATLNLLRLARLTGNTRYEELAEMQFKAFGGSASQYPMGHSILMSALSYATTTSREIVIIGNPEEEQTAAFVNAIQTRFLPNTVVVLKSEHNQEDIIPLAPYTAEHKRVEGKPAVYVCENFACTQPITAVEELEKILDSN